MLGRIVSAVIFPSAHEIVSLSAILIVFRADRYLVQFQITVFHTNVILEPSNPSFLCKYLAVFFICDSFYKSVTAYKRKNVLV